MSTESTEQSTGSSEGPARSHDTATGPRKPSSPDFSYDKAAHRKAHNEAWAASNLLMSGVLVWGGVGYALSAWLGSQLYVMFGLLLGTGTALYGIWVRYGRS